MKHIYGKTNIISHKNRPNIFINELKMYIDYLKKDMEEFSGKITAAQIKKWKNFKENLLLGIEYYQNLLEKTEFFKSDLNIKCLLQYHTSILSKIEIPEN